MYYSKMIGLTTGCLLWSSLAFGACNSTTCANGMGMVIEGADHASCYCLSKVGMNWWSAFSWCDAARGTLIDVNVDCQTVSGSSVDCPNLYNNGLDRGVWTRNTANGSRATYIKANGNTHNENKTWAGSYALCRGNY